MDTIATIVGLLPLISQELKLIDGLNNFFNFDHNIFLVDSSTDINQFIINGNYPQSLYFFDGACDNVAGLKSLTEIKSKNNFLIVGHESLRSFNRNINLMNRIKEIQRLDTSMKIGMFFSRHTEKEELRKLFQWCKENLIAYVFAATYSQSMTVEEFSRSTGSLNIFSFHPFGTFDVINVTNSETYKEFFPSLNYNFHKHKLRLSKFINIFDILFWNNAFDMMNATFQFLRDEYEVTTSLNVPSEGKIRMYPAILLYYKIVIPEAEPYSDFYAYLYTFTSEAFFGYFLGVIATVMLLLITFRYVKQKTFSFFESLMDVLNLLLNDNSYIKYQQLSRSEAFLIVPLTFVGLVFVNGILSNLRSYVTRPVLQPQIKTIDDIYNSGLSIAVNVRSVVRNTFLETLTFRSNHTDWEERIIVMNYDNITEKIMTFDKSMAYELTHHEHSKLLKVQKQLGIRGYYKTGIQIFNGLGFYPIHETFLFFERLNEIVGWMQNGGIYETWTDRMYFNYERALRRVYWKNLKDLEQIDFSEFPIFIFYGWLAGAIVLVIEIIWQNCTISWLKNPLRIGRWNRK